MEISALKQQIEFLQLQLEESKFSEASLKKLNESLLEQLKDQNNSDRNFLKDQVNEELKKENQQLQNEVNEIRSHFKTQIQELEAKIEGKKQIIKESSNLNQIQKEEIEKQSLKIKSLTLTLNDMNSKYQRLLKIHDQEVSRLKGLESLTQKYEKEQIQYINQTKLEIEQIQNQQSQNMSDLKSIYDQEKKLLTGKIESLEQQISDLKKNKTNEDQSTNYFNKQLQVTLKELEQQKDTNYQLQQKLIEQNLNQKYQGDNFIKQQLALINQITVLQQENAKLKKRREEYLQHQLQLKKQEEQIENKKKIIDSLILKETSMHKDIVEKNQQIMNIKQQLTKTLKKQKYQQSNFKENVDKYLKISPNSKQILNNSSSFNQINLPLLKEHQKLNERYNKEKRSSSQKNSINQNKAKEVQDQQQTSRINTYIQEKRRNSFNQIPKSGARQKNESFINANIQCEQCFKQINRESFLEHISLCFQSPNDVSGISIENDKQELFLSDLSTQYILNNDSKSLEQTQNSMNLQTKQTQKLGEEWFQEKIEMQSKFEGLINELKSVKFK